TASSCGRRSSCRSLSGNGVRFLVHEVLDGATNRLSRPDRPDGESWRRSVKPRSLQSAALFVLASCICAPRAGAQDPTAGPPATAADAQPGMQTSGTRGFAELGGTRFGTEDGMQAGLRVSSVTPNRPGLDFAFAAWFASEPVITSDLDLAFPVDL